MSTSGAFREFLNEASYIDIQKQRFELFFEKKANSYNGEIKLYPTKIFIKFPNVEKLNKCLEDINESIDEGQLIFVEKLKPNMNRKFLEDRFKLKIESDSKQISIVYSFDKEMKQLGLSGPLYRSVLTSYIVSNNLQNYFDDEFAKQADAKYKMNYGK